MKLVLVICTSTVVIAESYESTRSAPIGWLQLGFIAPVRIRVLPETVTLPDSGLNGWRNAWLETARPLPRALVSAITLSEAVLFEPP